MRSLRSRTSFCVFYALLILLGSATAQALPEVWIGGAGTSGDYSRLGFDGTFLGNSASGRSAVSAIAVVPEPSTALLLGLGLT
jgi:hypothetical protein